MKRPSQSSCLYSGWPLAKRLGTQRRLGLFRIPDSQPWTPLSCVVHVSRPLVGPLICRRGSSTSSLYTRSLRFEPLEDRRMLATFAEFIDPNPNPGNQFGSSVVPLESGNVVVTSPYDDAGGIDAGAVYLFDGSTGALISTLVGSTAFDFVGSSCEDARRRQHVVIIPDWDNGAATDAGAVTFGDGITGVSGVVSSANCLVGSTAVDQVGSGFSVVAFDGGNYVVLSPGWDNGAATDAGAVTFGNGITGVSGVVSSANSLVGSTAVDQVGSGFSVVTLDGGNYIVISPDWDNGAATDAGAVTFGDASSGGVSGVVSSANSLVGSTASDRVGSRGVVALRRGQLRRTQSRMGQRGGDRCRGRHLRRRQ